MTLNLTIDDLITFLREQDEGVEFQTCDAYVCPIARLATQRLGLPARASYGGISVGGDGSAGEMIQPFGWEGVLVQFMFRLDHNFGPSYKKTHVSRKQVLDLAIRIRRESRKNSV